MRVLVSGSSGLIGSALVPLLQSEGHTVGRFVRGRPRGAEDVQWDPEIGAVDHVRLVGYEAVIHLAGENLAKARWTPEVKSRIRESRVRGTRTLAEALARLPEPPRVLVSASAVGYYGDRGDEVLTEESGPGGGFLAEVCQAWEAAAEPAEQAGIRVVRTRLGGVLSREGGALAKVLPIFRAGLGGRVGPGSQFMSWVAVDDALAALREALVNESLSGPVNVTSPNPVTNAGFTHALARVLGRPALMPAPPFMLRMALGEMADEVVLASQRVVPAKLQALGFRFAYPELEPALRHLLSTG